MRLLKAVVLLAGLALGAGLLAADQLPGAARPELADGLYAEFTTPHGAVVAELLADKVPLTVTNFVGLTEGTLGPKQATPYFTGLKWYRVVPGFVIQSGNPKAPVDGDAGYTFPDEFAPGLRHGTAGILSMANGGPDTNSAEFFITLGDDTRLNYLHSVFGRVVRGLDVLPQIKPDEPFSIKILRIGAAATAFKADEAAFQSLLARAPKYSGEPDIGPTAHFDDPDKLLPVDPPRAKNFNYKLANFERTTGVRIVARVFAKEPPAAEDNKPGAYMSAMATRLGTIKHGALLCYFVADDDWRVWVGDEMTSTFLGRPSVPADLVPEGAFHKVKEAFLTAAQAEGDAAFARQQKAAPADKPPAPGQKIKLEMDAMIDGLIFKLEPK
jgi:cyclophilin family peptidyl-prolyl cis-trans isomerase